MTSFATSQFNYNLPEEAVAQSPAEPRSAARLLVALGPGLSDVEHRQVSDLPGYIGSGDVVVVNDTQVLPARLVLRKATGGSAEVLLVEPLGDNGDPEGPGDWEGLVRPSRRLRPGTVLHAADGRPVLVVGERLGQGRRRVRLLAPMDEHGQLPLPPYIHEPLPDPARYQTVYARRPGSVAAPTAGLHLTTQVLEAIRNNGAAVHAVDLAVGIGTFRPMTTERADDHVMHEERYAVPAETMAACEGARRVVAVGTTTVRALESAAATGRLEGRTDLFIRPGFDFRVVDLLLTNFHLPRSSLLVMLAAFAGHQRWRDLYSLALSEKYRFLSFGDAMLVSRAGPHPRPPRQGGDPNPAGAVPLVSRAGPGAPGGA